MGDVTAGGAGGAAREACRAKLNLFLDVVGRRADGYHDLVTVFHQIDLADDLVARSGVPGAGVTLTLTGDAAGVPADGTNLAVRAVRALLAAAGRGGDDVALELDKHVPAGGGLGGGSSDAAGALRAVNRLLSLGRDEGELVSVAASLGSDVPFLVRGGTALGRGRGEILEPLPAPPPMRFSLIVPSFGVSTAAVYRALPADLPAPVDPAAALAALAAGDPDALAATFHNALADAAFAVEPRLAEVAALLARAGPRRPCLTGSGSVFFVPMDEGEAPPAVDHPLVRRVLTAG